MAQGTPWDGSTCHCVHSEPVQTASWPGATTVCACSKQRCRTTRVTLQHLAPLIPRPASAASTRWRCTPHNSLVHSYLSVTAFCLSAPACAVFGSITEDPNLQIAAAAGEALRQLCWFRQGARGEAGSPTQALSPPAHHPPCLLPVCLCACTALFTAVWYQLLLKGSQLLSPKLSKAYRRLKAAEQIDWDSRCVLL